MVEKNNSGRVRLDLRGKGLNSLPDSIGELTELEILVLDSNQLASLPDWIGQLRNLRTLSLYNNRLDSLPESVWQLDNLRTQRSGNNSRIDWISNRIGIPILEQQSPEVLARDIRTINTTGLFKSHRQPAGYSSQLDRALQQARGTSAIQQ
jgi:Leucine-rich repeat (LRR) protein